MKEKYQKKKEKMHSTTRTTLEKKYEKNKLVNDK